MGQNNQTLAGFVGYLWLSCLVQQHGQGGITYSSPHTHQKTSAPRYSCTGFKTSQNTSDLSEQWSPLVMAFFKLEKQRATWDFFISYFFLQNKRQTKQKHFKGRDWAKKLRINMSPRRDFPLLLSPPKKPQPQSNYAYLSTWISFLLCFALKSYRGREREERKKE